MYKTIAYCQWQPTSPDCIAFKNLPQTARQQTKTEFNYAYIARISH